MKPVAMLALDQFVLWVNSETPYKTPKDYIEAVKAGTDRQFKMGGTGSKQEDQIVTAAILERAQHLGVQEQLLAATVGRPAQAGGTDTRAALVGGLENVSSGASNLFDRAKGWLGERREDAETALDERQQAAHEQKIKDALGRPVNRVILAPDDSIILNLGEIVTHKAVELATQGDVLDILLDSVSTETPDINPLDSRPDEHEQSA